MWGTPTLILLLVLGVYFTRKSRFYMPRALRKIAADTIGSLKEKPQNGISPFSAVATALGGTVGIGSIVGVGYALTVGGAGSIFWMWVCSFFGMGIKYSEVKIALSHRQQTKNGYLGGAPFRLDSLGYKKTALLFCVICLLVSFTTGNLTQTGVMASFFITAGLPKGISTGICFVIMAIALLGGRSRIAKINSFIVPASSAVYLLCCLCILIVNLDNVPTAFANIFSQAFGFSAVSGGFSGAMLAHVIREGFARSLFSNEAGMGSSPLAHATADGNPWVQAEWGIFEIFFDTFIISTLTALCLLASGITEVSQMFASMFGGMGFWLFGILSAVFAFASVISWCYYGECCISFIFPESKNINRIYRFLFSLATIAGAYISDQAIWLSADILNALMMLPNLFLLFKCRDEIERMI